MVIRQDYLEKVRPRKGRKKESRLVFYGGKK